MMKLTLALAVENVPSIPKLNTFIGQLQKLREGSPSSAPCHLPNPGQLCVTVGIILDSSIAIYKQISSGCFPA